MDADAPTHPVDDCNANFTMSDHNDVQHSPNTSPNPPTLDGSRFPHILDRIIELAPILALVNLHDVSRYVRAQAELQLSRHLRVTRTMYGATTFAGVTHEYCLEPWEYESDFPSWKPSRPLCLGDDCLCGPGLTPAAAFKAAHKSRFGYLTHVVSRLLCALDHLTLTLVGLDEVAGPDIGMPFVRPLKSGADNAAEVEKWFYGKVTEYLRESPRIGGMGEEAVQDALCKVYFKDRETWLEEDHGDFDLDDWNPFGDERF
ncbi:hypothetical protein CcaverHIS002_0309680 [Cutaneotrichosporon cavernicola]|nr:hypothetical protein CcaverHIS002_0309680 [Cutaneotrichosporon cavernicola]